MHTDTHAHSLSPKSGRETFHREPLGVLPTPAERGQRTLQVAGEHYNSRGRGNDQQDGPLTLTVAIEEILQVLPPAKECARVRQCTALEYGLHNATRTQHQLLEGRTDTWPEVNKSTTGDDGRDQGSIVECRV
jgi:hypothetical protein